MYSELKLTWNILPEVTAKSRWNKLDCNYSKTKNLVDPIERAMLLSTVHIYLQPIVTLTSDLTHKADRFMP